MSGKILVATDGSDTAERALDCAAELSAKLERDLSIVHVFLHGRPSEELTRLAESEHLVKRAAPPAGLEWRAPRGMNRNFEEESEFARSIAAAGNEILLRAKDRAERAGARNVTTLARDGDYADEVLDAAEAEGAEMIVLGSRGLGRVRGTLLGSVSQKVLHHASCTVVVVR